MEPYKYKASKIGHSIGHKAKHSKSKRIKITCNISSDHSGIEPKTKGKNYVNDTWRENNTPLLYEHTWTHRNIYVTHMYTHNK